MDKPAIFVAFLASKEDFLKKQLLASSLVVVGRWDCVHVQVFDPVMNVLRIKKDFKQHVKMFPSYLGSVN